MTREKQILSDIVVFTKYARYRKDLKRRETWKEIVDRNKEMHLRKYPELAEEINSAYQYVYRREVLPSMRSMQFAGEAIERNNTRIFNCAYLPIEDVAAFGEVMYLLLGGSGVGFSVQKHHVEKLPRLKAPEEYARTFNPIRIVVEDSIEGWADCIKKIVQNYVRGFNFTINYSAIRPEGSPLRVTGGKAPGPEPLKIACSAIRQILDKAKGRKLRPIEVHDIICHASDAVRAGGIRRSALISLFDFDDLEMITSKSPVRVDIQTLTEDEFSLNGIATKENGEVAEVWLDGKDLEQYRQDSTVNWYWHNPQRGRANNSAVLERGVITEAQFKDLWLQVELSNAGEPGFYWTNNREWGTNPCCEIALRPYTFCNLCEIDATTIRDYADLAKRIEAASVIGTLQASYTKFNYLRPIWQQNTEEDSLIGVGITGIASNTIRGQWLTYGSQVARTVNKTIAEKIGINQAARLTTVKPSGTASLVLGTSSGIHAWHDEYYIRRMRLGKNEPIYQYLLETNPDLLEDDVYNPNGSILSIPQKAPDGAATRHESTLEFLERIRKYNALWVHAGHNRGDNTNNVSATVSVKDGEWEEVGNWMWEHQDFYNGLSVLNYDGGTYVQAPYETITEEEFNKLLPSLQYIDLTRVSEEEDDTDLVGEVACAGGACEIV